jgi:hypothetical protein
MRFDVESTVGEGRGYIGMFSAVIATAAQAIGDPVRIVIPAFADHIDDAVSSAPEWGPCVWQPSWGDSLPLPGDAALVAFDNYRTPWIIAWVPSVYVPITGGGGSDVKYTHTQGSAATTWTITHNLGLFPVVSVVDNSGDEILANVHYTSNNQITISFDVAQAGKAYLS